MAIKAGRVGVAPSQVDMAGNVIGGVDAYTKAESDAKYATKTDSYTKLEVNELLGSKVGIGQLTANNKAFHFAYDNTSEKYGYKLDGTGDFIPFEEGGIGWIPPAELITTGIVYNTDVVYKSGGYYVDEDTDTVYVDITVTLGVDKTSVKAYKMLTFPNSIAPIDIYTLSAEHDDLTRGGAPLATNGSLTYYPGFAYSSTTISANDYRFFGTYKTAT